jgi:hypothetical protein
MDQVLLTPHPVRCGLAQKYGGKRTGHWAVNTVLASDITDGEKDHHGNNVMII